MPTSDVVVLLRGEITDFQRKMATASGEIDRLGAKASGVQKFAAVGKAALLGLGAAAVAVGGYGVKMATDFEAAMEKIHTQAGASQKEVDSLKDKVLALAPAVGVGPQQLADALYHLESVGLRGAQAMDVLKLSAEGAKVGNADLESTANALSSTMVNQLKDVHNATDAMGLLNATVGAGNMRMEDLVGALSTGILPAAKNVGLGLQDVGAALATMTDAGTPAEEAATRLRMTFALLASPTQQAQKALAGVGISSTQLGHDMQSGGIVKAIQDLHDRLQSIPDPVKRAQVLMQAFGGGRSSAGILTLVNNLDRLKTKFGDIGAGAKKFGADWDATQKTFKQQVDQVVAQLQAWGVKIGEWLIPKLQTLMQWTQTTAEWFEKHRAAAYALATVIGGTLVAAITAFIALKVQAAIEAISEGFQLLESFAGNAAARIANLVAPTEALTAADTELATAEDAAAASGSGMSASFLAGAGVLGLVAAGAVLLGNATDHLGTQIKAVDASTSHIAKTSLPDLTAEIKRSITAHNSWTDALKNLVTGGVHAADAEKNLKNVHKQFDDVLKDSIPDAQKFMQAAHEAGVNTSGWATEIDRAKTKQSQLSQATIQATAAAASNDTQNKNLTSSTDALTTASQELDQTLQVIKTSWDALIGVNIDSEKAHLQVLDSLAQLTQSFKDNGLAIDDNSDKGVKNLEAGQNLIDMVKSHADAVYKQTGSIDSATAALKNDEGAMYLTARATGLSDQAALHYIETVLGIPADKATNIHNNADLANYIVSGYKGNIQSVPVAKTTTFTANTAAATAAVDALHQKWVNVFTGGPSFNFNHRAAGGPVAAGTPYVVGEKGPEVFVPKTAGAIIPHAPVRTSGTPIGVSRGTTPTTVHPTVIIHAPAVIDPSNVVPIVQQALQKMRRDGWSTN